MYYKQPQKSTIRHKKAGVTRLMLSNLRQLQQFSFLVGNEQVLNDLGEWFKVVGYLDVLPNRAFAYVGFCGCLL